MIASTLSNSHNLTWPKRDAKKPNKSGDLESRFFPSSFAILLRLATTNWLPTVIVDTVSKKMGKEDKVLLKSDLRYIVQAGLSKASTRGGTVYNLQSVPSNLPCVSLDFAAAHARVLSTQSILTGLKSTVVQMEKVLLEDKKLLQSFEATDVDPDSAPTR
nr:hypothetical protein Iba_chr14bCG9440 [Ipomoea batatas]